MLCDRRLMAEESSGREVEDEGKAVEKKVESSGQIRGNAKKQSDGG